MDANELVTVYTLNDATQAELIRNALHDEGIACEIDGENQAGLTGILEIKILCRAVDADRARKFIESHEHHSRD